MNEATRKRARVAGKLLASACLLAFLAWKLDLRAIRGALLEISPGLVLAILAATGIGALLAAYRWQRVIHHMGHHAALWPLLKDLLVGRAFNLLLPTQVGGDVARAMRSGERLRSRPDAWAAILYERLVGLLVLTLLPFAGLVFVPVALPGRVWRIAVVCLGIVGAALLFLDRLLPFAAQITRRLPRISASLRAIANALRGDLATWPARLEIAGWSVLSQIAALLPLALAALAWEIPGVTAAVFIGVPIVLILSMVPITLGGFGLRESLFVVILTPLGVDPERALALSLVWLLSLLASALAGLAVIALERGEKVAESA